MPLFQIRPATPDDIEQIVLIKNIAWVYAYKGIMSDDFLFARTSADKMHRTVQKWRQLTANTDTTFLVAQDATGVVAGFVWGGAVSNPAIHAEKELYALYVHPARHGVGIGKDLLSAFAGHMRSTGAKTFVVGCLSANPSLNFYKKMGGRVVTEIPNPYFENLSETFLEFNI